MNGNDYSQQALSKLNSWLYARNTLDETKTTTKKENKIQDEQKKF